MIKVSDIFSEKSVTEEVFVETKVVEEVAKPKATKKEEVFSPKEVQESKEIFPTPKTL
jgi:hypothetical protein